MSFTFSRRILLRTTALGTVGLGGITVLSACSNTSQNSTERSSYKGEAKLDSYDTSAGTYELASREHPARNVPKPVKPTNMNDNSVAGLYSTIAFFAAALQYRLITGDAQYLKEVKLEHTVDSIEEITNGSPIPRLRLSSLPINRSKRTTNTFGLQSSHSPRATGRSLNTEQSTFQKMSKKLQVKEKSRQNTPMAHGLFGTLLTSLHRIL